MRGTVHALLFALIALALVACGKSTPASPTPTPPPPTPVSMTIAGTTSLDHPGETSRLTATVTFSDNTSKDVTTDASWVGQDQMITVNGSGVITAERYGTGSVSARYATGGSLVNATARIRVAPAGAFVVSGQIRAPGGDGLAQASVKFSSGAGTYSTTTGTTPEFIGYYFLPAAGQSTIRVDASGFVGQVKQMTVTSDTIDVHFELQPIT